MKLLGRPYHRRYGESDSLRKRIPPVNYHLKCSIRFANI